MPVKKARAAANANALLLENQMCFALYAASLAMTKVYRPLLAALGLTYPQYIVMLVLWEQDGLTVSALGARLSLDSGTLTPLLKRLEALALVRRTRGAADQREVYLHLTAKGKALRVQAPDIHRQVACATGCTADQIKTLTASLHRLRASLLQQIPA